MTAWIPCTRCGEPTYFAQIRISKVEALCSKCVRAKSRKRGSPAAREKKLRAYKQEKKIAIEVGGRVIRASGALPGPKGDAIDEEFLIEAKYTDRKSYTIKHADWMKLASSAANHRRKPRMEIELAGQVLVVLAKRDFLTLVGLA